MRIHKKSSQEIQQLIRSKEISAGASANFTQTTQLDQISKIVDYVQLMTYDVHGIAWPDLMRRLR